MLQKYQILKTSLLNQQIYKSSAFLNSGLLNIQYRNFPRADNSKKFRRPIYLD